MIAKTLWEEQHLLGQYIVAFTPYNKNLQSFSKYLRLALVSCEIVDYGKRLVSAFKGLLLVLIKSSFFQGDWALGYHSMKFKHFPDISLFHKVLSHNS